jgi:hypothetical protein
VRPELDDFRLALHSAALIAANSALLCTWDRGSIDPLRLPPC